MKITKTLIGGFLLLAMMVSTVGQPIVASAQTRERDAKQKDVTKEKVVSVDGVGLESAADPEIKRTRPLTPRKQTTDDTVGDVRIMSVEEAASGDVDSLQSMRSSVSALSVSSANLFNNPSVEEETSPGMPVEWKKGGYGTNNRVLSLVEGGYNSDKALKVEITEYTNGDAKWYSNDINVTPGKTYEFIDYYKSDVPSIILARFTKTDGTYIYKDLEFLPQSPEGYSKASAEFVGPEGVKSVSIFHLIKSNGYLITDEFSLAEEFEAGGDIAPAGNLVPNYGFNAKDSNGYPIGWKKGGWGNNKKAYGVGTPRYENSTVSLSAFILSYTSGDVKWYFDPVTVESGKTYTYTDKFASDVENIVTAQYVHSDGSLSYEDLAFLKPTNNEYKVVEVDFTIPENVEKVSVFHLIKGVGGLTIDNVAIFEADEDGEEERVGIFKTGAVTLRFDDGWLSQYDNALPKLKETGLKGTFYVISERTPENGFVGYFSPDQIVEIYNAGHEIGSHTKTHPHLSGLTPEEQRDEIVGSREDLLALNVGPITSFSYPFGDYNETTLQIVEEAGYSNAASTIDGLATPDSVPLELERQGITNTTTLEEIKGWVDDAKENKKWLILSFHEINHSGNLYAITPELFNEVIDYIAQSDLPVVTATEGSRSLE